MGKINNSGKTAMFCDGVRISYYDKYLFETCIVEYLRNNKQIFTDDIKYHYSGAQIVIQKVRFKKKIKYNKVYIIYLFN